jgi:amino acid permease
MKKIDKDSIWSVVLFIAAAFFGVFFFLFLLNRHQKNIVKAENSNNINERVNKKLASVWQTVASNLELSANKMLNQNG